MKFEDHIESIKVLKHWFIRDETGQGREKSGDRPIFVIHWKDGTSSFRYTDDLSEAIPEAEAEVEAD